MLLGLLVLPLSLVMAVGLLSGNTHAATKNWTGATGAYFSTDTNWSPVGAPVDGDTLVFDANSASGNPTNDMADLEVGSIEYIGKEDVSGYFSCLWIRADSRLKVSGNIEADKGCTDGMRGKYILGANVVAKNVRFVPMDDNEFLIELNGYKLTFTADTQNGVGVIEAAHDQLCITGNGTVEFNVPTNLSADVYLHGANDYSGTTNVIASGGWVKGVRGNSISMFGTSTVNVTGEGAAVSYDFYNNALGGKTIGNVFNVQGGQSDDLWGTLQFYCNMTNCEGGVLKVPNIKLLGNTALEQMGFKNNGFVVDLAGIQANGHCVEYWVDSIASHISGFDAVRGGFINGPDACKVDGGDVGGGVLPGPSGPGAPNTGEGYGMGELREWRTIGIAGGAVLIAGAVLYGIRPWVVRKIRL